MSETDFHNEENKPDGIAVTEDEFAAAISPPDLKGRINLRVESMLQEEIENIAEDSRYPLNSVSEVIRYCCLLGLSRLRQWKPAPTLIGAIRAANALVVRDKLQCDATDLLERMDERINWYIERGHYDEAIDLVGQVRSHFEGLPKDFWSVYIKDEIDKRFMQWLERIDATKES